jgi:hypothetical protein
MYFPPVNGRIASSRYAVHQAERYLEVLGQPPLTGGGGVFLERCDYLAEGSPRHPSTLGHGDHLRTPLYGI